MMKSTIYQVTAEDLRQFGMDLIMAFKRDYEAEHNAEQELGPVPDCATLLCVTEQTVRNMIERGAIRSVRVGRRVMVDMAQVRRDMAAGRIGKGKHTHVCPLKVVDDYYKV